MDAVINARTLVLRADKFQKDGELEAAAQAYAEIDAGDDAAVSFQCAMNRGAAFVTMTKNHAAQAEFEAATRMRRARRAEIVSIRLSFFVRVFKSADAAKIIEDGRSSRARSTSGPATPTRGTTSRRRGATPATSRARCARSTSPSR